MTWLVAFVLVLIATHEAFVVLSPPVPFAHQISHFTLLMIAAASGIGIWAFWGAYRSLEAHQRRIANGYARLDQTVQEKTRDLLASKALLQSLFDAVQVRMVVVDSESKVIRANKTATADLGRDPRGESFSEAFPGCGLHDERRSELRSIEYTFRTKAPQRNRLVVGGRGCDRMLEIDTFPVLDEAGDVQLVIEVARDVTEYKEDQALANHYEKMAALGLLAAGIAHDLGNPLASLSSELQMLRREDNIERIRASLQVLERHLDRITRSVRDILGFARKRSDRSPSASLGSAVEDVMRLLRHDPGAESVRFEVKVPQQLPAAAIKEDDLVLVLLNVMINAIHAMPKSGEVRIAARPANRDHVVLTIRDTGSGMDAETLANAVKPLYTTKPGSTGTGLGLAVASTIMQRVGGKLSIDSVPGRGTTVTLQLPQSPQQSRGYS
ncbi:MAG: ATP-binding protein [Gammaproteobacteria bacterium]